MIGWVKKKLISGYSAGIEKVPKDEYAWTQEGREEEAIIRPSDGAILTPLAKNDSVLNHDATSNLFNFANDPREFIRDNENVSLRNILKEMSEQNLRIGSSKYSIDTTPQISGLIDISNLLSIVKNQNRKSNSTSVGDIHITIPIEHVDDYNDFVTQLQHDKQFERMVRSVSVDLLSGKSELTKNNYKW